jgi:hypothetical protein
MPARQLPELFGKHDRIAGESNLIAPEIAASSASV